VPLNPFSSVYSSKTDEELLALAADQDALNEDARSALTEEIGRRNLPIESPVRTDADAAAATLSDSKSSEQRVPSDEKPSRYNSAGWQMLLFLLHLAAVYVIVKFFTQWLAGWTRGTVLPLLQNPTSYSRLEFLYSHLFALTFLPAFFAGLINARFKQKAAQFVWLVPTVILAYKFATFPAPSALQSQFSAAFHQYFGGGFVIAEFRNWREFWNLIRSNSDMMRGMAQMQYTAPFYAGVAYSLAAWIGRQTDLNRRVKDKVESWERSRFGHQSYDPIK